MRFFGWTVEGEPPDAAKVVFVAAPHTSNWDQPFMLALAWSKGLKISWMGKKELFKPATGWFMRWLGGVSVDRGAPKGTVEQVARAFRDADSLLLVIPPAGTRKKRPYWKSGFIHIAKAAGVPIVPGYLDYARKVARLGEPIDSSQSLSEIMDRMRAFYAGVQGKYPELQSRILLREEEDDKADQKVCS